MKLSEILDKVFGGERASRVSWISKNGEVINRILLVKEDGIITPFAVLEWGYKEDFTYPWIPQYQDLKADDWFLLTEKDFQEWIGG